MQKIIEKYAIFDPKWDPKSIPKSMQKSMRKIVLFWTPFETCLISEREARYNDKTGWHMSLHAAASRCLQMLAPTCCIPSLARALCSRTVFVCISA